MTIQEVKDGQNWKLFYEWLKENGYDTFRHYNIFRGNKYITDFDCQEDGDSGEIEETMDRIIEMDSMYLKNKGLI